MQFKSKARKRGQRGKQWAGREGEKNRVYKKVAMSCFTK
jgi:hypothetical protein